MAPEAEILLADDDDVGRYVIATMLRRAGFTVREVDGRRAGRDRRAARPTGPRGPRRQDAGLDGFEACRRLKSDEATRHIPVLMLSATFLETEAQVEGLETGADGYLTQPVEAPVLAATVRSLLRARRAEAEVRERGAPSGARRSTRSATRSPCSTRTGCSSAPTARSPRSSDVSPPISRGAPWATSPRRWQERSRARRRRARSVSGRSGALRRGRRRCGGAPAFGRRPAGRHGGTARGGRARRGARARAHDLAHAAAEPAARAAARDPASCTSTPGTSPPSAS